LISTGRADFIPVVPLAPVVAHDLLLASAQANGNVRKPIIESMEGAMRMERKGKVG
jgi:hypothetical protein